VSDGQLTQKQKCFQLFFELSAADLSDLLGNSSLTIASFGGLKTRDVHKTLSDKTETFHFSISQDRDETEMFNP